MNVALEQQSAYYVRLRSNLLDMLSKRLLFVFALASNVLATSGIVNVTSSRFGCGNEMSDEAIEAAENDFQLKMVDHLQLISINAAAAAANVSVYFHIISRDQIAAGGNVSDSQIEEQISVLNSDFSGSELSFALGGVTRTVSSDWLNNVAPESLLQSQMKDALREGGEADLNVYTVGFNSVETEGLSGYATFPWSYSTAPENDGIVIQFTTLPGGSQQNFNGGQVLTHETGHWVGLYHTFQGGCSGSGDSASDTPAEAEPSNGCPEGRNTCSSTDVDPINNFMDYTYDSCRTEFTLGQIAGLRIQTALYRGL